jgi:hypothetical protein
LILSSQAVFLLLTGYLATGLITGLTLRRQESCFPSAGCAAFAVVNFLTGVPLLRSGVALFHRWQMVAERKNRSLNLI